jgi:hypothetical protein
MILENKVTLVIMLCQEMENGKVSLISMLFNSFHYQDMSFGYFESGDDSSQYREFGAISINVT